MVFMLLTALTALSSNYFTMGVNDTLRINPGYLGANFTAAATAHFDGRVNYWCVNVLSPGLLKTKAFVGGPGLIVPYLDSNGTSTTCQASFNVNFLTDSISQVQSEITEIGYWDYNNSGNYAPYGIVKWEAGNHEDMFRVQFEVSPQFTGGTLVLFGNIESGDDARGGGVGHVTFYKSVQVTVGYKRGDVNGDEEVNTSDANLLINCILNDVELDSYQFEAADMNGDGYVNSTDASMLINYILNN